MSKSVLGRGLGALMEGGAPRDSSSESTAAPEASRSVEGSGTIPIEALHASPLQPRRDFPEESISELAQSIRANGIIQPLIVRPRADGGFELIAGERRLRAAKTIGLTEVPVVIRETEDREVLEMMLIENLQREGLNPIDEADGYAELQNRFRLTQEAIAERVGKSRATVANALRLLKLPAKARELLANELITSGHAKALLGLKDPKDQLRLAERIAQKGLSVREVETLVANWGKAPTDRTQDGSGTSNPTRNDPHIAAIEQNLRETLGAKVRLKVNRGKGNIEISFFSSDELNRLLGILGVDID